MVHLVFRRRTIEAGAFHDAIVRNGWFISVLDPLFEKKSQRLEVYLRIAIALNLNPAKWKPKAIAMKES